MRKRAVDDLIRDYHGAERSFTFAAYNDAILLANECVRLRKLLAKLKKEKRS